MKFLKFLFLVLLSVSSYSQVGIGTFDPAPESLLHIESSNKGLLIPKIALEDIHLLTPISSQVATEGLLIYNINPSIGKGFYCWNGSDQWISLNKEISLQLGTHDQVLSSDRQIDFNGNSLSFISDPIVNLHSGHLQLNESQSNLLKWAGNINFSSILKDGPILHGTTGGVFGTHSNEQKAIMEWFADGAIKYNQYPLTSSSNEVAHILGIEENNGQMVSTTTSSIHAHENKDWFLQNSLTIPENITDNIHTQGQVGIGTNNPMAVLHVFEEQGTAPENLGTILVEHENLGEKSSVIMQHGTTTEGMNAEISYSMDSENIDSTANFTLKNNTNTSENDINFESNGNIIHTLNEANRYKMTPEAFTPEMHQEYSLGAPDQKWNSIFTQNMYTSNDLESGEDAYFYSYGNGDESGEVSTLLAVDSTGKVIEVMPSNPTGVQFYSYKVDHQPNPAIFLSPPLDPLIFNDTIANSGHYAGVLNHINAMQTMKPIGASDGYIIKIVGYYNVKNEGIFNFTSKSDDGARIYIDDSLILDLWIDINNGIATGSANLAKGKHKIEFWYYENDGNQRFTYMWGENPDGIPPGSVIHANQFSIN